jgi:hypothetical protein
MSKMPWVKWFDADWLSDPCLTMCSAATRGIWMDVLAATRLKDAGELTGTVKSLARICRCDEREMDVAIKQISETCTGQITKQNGSITITCRRIKKAFDISTKRADAGQKGGSKPKANDQAKRKQLSASASASVSNSSSREGDSKGGGVSNSITEDFDRCWGPYPKKAGKPRALRAFKKYKPSADTVLAAIARYIAFVQNEHAGGFQRSYADGGTWFHNQQWEDSYEIARPHRTPSADGQKKRNRHLDAAKAAFMAATTYDEKENAICNAHHSVIHAVEDWAKQAHGFERK